MSVVFGWCGLEKPLHLFLPHPFSVKETYSPPWCVAYGGYHGKYIQIMEAPGD